MTWHSGSLSLLGAADCDWQEGRLTKQSSNANVSFLVLRFFKEWWEWTRDVQGALLEDVGCLARADERAVEWDTLRVVFWWISWRGLLADGEVVVNRYLWVTVGCTGCPS